jgi:hypothetical protein
MSMSLDELPNRASSSLEPQREIYVKAILNAKDKLPEITPTPPSQETPAE